MYVEWNGNGTTIQRMDNGSSIKGSQLVYNQITSWAPWTENLLSDHWIFVPFPFHSRSVPVPFPLHYCYSSVPFPVHSCSSRVPVQFHSRSFHVQLNRTAMEWNGTEIEKKQMSRPYSIIRLIFERARIFFMTYVSQDLDSRNYIRCALAFRWLVSGYP